MDVDFGMIAGTGWAPFRGGPLRYADSVGARTIVDSLERLASCLDERFEPCEYLLDLARKNKTFYSEPSRTVSSISSNIKKKGSPNENHGTRNQTSGSHRSHPGIRRKKDKPSKLRRMRGRGLMDGFASGIFLGSPKFSPLYQVIQKTSDGDEGEKFLRTLERTLDLHANPDEIDETGEIPDSLLKKLAEIGAFGIKIPKEYGGLGLSQATYSRAAKLLGSRCGNLTALLSAHQSIGLPQPLLRYGTEEQKKKFLPDVAKGAITAFALTEDEVGSDPSRLNTRANQSREKSYLINGQKLWCTNGTKAKYLVVMARTPSTTGAGGKRQTIHHRLCGRCPHPWY